MIWNRFTSLFEEAGDASGGGDAAADAADDKADEGDAADAADAADGNDDAADEGDKDELTEEDVKEARALYALLKNPAHKTEVIKSLAEKAGLLTKPGEAPLTKPEERVAKREIKAILKESLGQQYFDLIGDKIGTALEQILEQQREEFEGGQKALETKQVEQETDRALGKLASETKNDSRKFEKRMSELASKMHPAPGVSIYEYARNLYAIASSERTASKTATEISDKIMRNSRNVSDRIGNAPGGGAASQKAAPAKAPTGLKNIVAHVVGELSKGK
jgi:hypothetical protein